jgi:sulfoacetaldehyde acetyltransferase
MSLAETLTCVRERLPVVAVVFHNGLWGAEARNQHDFYGGRLVASELENPSFAEVARAMGAEGVRVSHPDEVGDALRTLVRSERPAVLELMLDQQLAEPFRRDALRKPRRHLDRYRHTSVE